MDSISRGAYLAVEPRRVVDIAWTFYPIRRCVEKCVLNGDTFGVDRSNLNPDVALLPVDTSAPGPRGARSKRVARDRATLTEPPGERCRGRPRGR